jgi:heme/copper-type cytochrome/quinol oxidase subunit 2
MKAKFFSTRYANIKEENVMLLDLFIWWIISISWSIVFLIVVGIYLYADSSKKRRENSQIKRNATRIAKDFVFIWILTGLLVFYIISVNIGSSTLFAVGNIIVEAILILHILKNKG